MKGVGGSRSRRFRQAPSQITGGVARIDRTNIKRISKVPRSAANPGMLRRAWGLLRRLFGRRPRPERVARRPGIIPCKSMESDCHRNPVSVFCPEHRAQYLAIQRRRAKRKVRRDYLQRTR